MSGLVAFTAPVLANENLTGSASIQAVFDDNWMIDHPGIAAADESIVVNYDWNNGNLYYLGDDEADLEIPFLIGGTSVDDNTDVTFTLSAGTGNTLVTPGDTSSVVVNDPDGVGGVTAWDAGNTITPQFTIDVGNAGNVETTYEMRVAVQYTMAGATETNTLTFEVYLSSLWHPDTSNTLRDTEYELPDVVDASTGGDAPFEAGDTFKAAEIVLTNNAWFGVTELNGTLTSLDSQISLYNDLARTPAGVASGNQATFNYRVDVANRTDPGDDYEGTFVTEYVRNVGGLDVHITENARTTHFAVDFSFADDDPMEDGVAWSEYQCYATDVQILNSTRQVDYVAPYDIPTITQSTYTDEPLRLQVTIVNNGNTPLYNVQFAINPGAWTYFRNPQFFWDSGGVIQHDTISNTYDTFNVGDTITLTVEVIVDADIPIGEHRLPITYNGFYFNDGSLGGATGYMPTNGGTDLEVVFSLQVTDTAIACHVTNVAVGGIGDKNDITAEVLTVSLRNDEQYNFIDVEVRANFTDTPWYMPVINMGDPWVWADNANPAMPLAAWTGAGTINVDFTVDTNPNMTPDRYPFQLEITAVIEETLEVVTVTVDYTQGAVVDYAGYGPDIFISSFANEDIVPGQGFDLTLSLENTGDETLRDVTVLIPTNGTDPAAWTVEQDFKQQFDWSQVYENWMDVSGPIQIPDGMFYTVKDLDVDNIKEIYEINLYVDGIYSRPSAVIAVIHITDLAPGASTNVSFQMLADKDMVNGKPYDFPVSINGVDPDGNNYNVDRWISVMTSLPGDHYNPVEPNWFDAGLKALTLVLFFIIIAGIFMFLYNRFKGEPYDEDEDEFDFEDEDEDMDFEPVPEPADTNVPPPPLDAPPEAPPEELVEP